MKKFVFVILMLGLFLFVGCSNKIDIPTRYKVTIDANGGVFDKEYYLVNEGVIMAKVADPTRSGYTFDGWYCNDEKWDFETGEVYEDMTLTARWAQNITIYLKGNDKYSPSVTKIEKLKGENYSIPNDTVPGYSIKWYNGDTEVERNGKCNFDSDVTFTAKLTLLTYTIEYIANEGTDYSANPTTYDVENVVSFEAPTSVKEGDEFLAWCTDEARTNEVVDSEGLSGNLKLYAKYVDPAEKEFVNLVADFIADFNSVTENELTSASQLDTEEIDSDAALTFMNDASMKTKWTWLFSAIYEVAGKPAAEEDPATTETFENSKAFYLTNLCAFLTKTKHTDTYLEKQSVDFSNAANFDAVWNAKPAE